MRLFHELPDDVKTLWAKSIEPDGYGIICHMLDVAAVAEIILEREPEATLLWAAKGLGLKPDNCHRWIATLIGLHDFGKAIPGFQVKWEKGKENNERVGLKFDKISLGAKWHNYALMYALKDLLLGKIKTEKKWVRHIIKALSAHHGYFPKFDEIKESSPSYEDSNWKRVRGLLFEFYWETLAPEGNPSSTEIELPILTWFTGLTSVADWIGSSKDWFPIENGPRDVSLLGHYEKAKKLAAQALDEIGWSNFRVILQDQSSIEEQLKKIMGSPLDVSSRPLQVVGSELLKDAKGPSLMIVEAPMGEGKTELAFLSYLHLQKVNSHRGLYIALPTQATSNAIFDRTITFLNNFNKDIKLDIQLVHSGTLMNERVQNLRESAIASSTSIDSSVWFSCRKRGLISPYGVGTIDQALFANLNVKHHFVRLWGLANKVVIFDEVHAYDTYTSSLIESLLPWLKELNCSVVLMSATLPFEKRKKLIKAWDRGISSIETPPYPRLTMISNSDVLSRNVSCRQLDPIQVFGIEENLEAIADEAVNKLKFGGCGAIIVNTVQRAQDLYVLMKERITIETELIIFHARYPSDIRLKKESLILKKFGNPSTAQERPKNALLIATQVVEQSLDIDFDFMISDLAPVDLLLQRAGRLHRHQRVREKNHQSPCILIAGLIKERLPEIAETHWGYVYDPLILYRTWAFISRESVWNLPNDIDRLVQLVYGQDDLLEEITESMRDHIDKSWGEYRAEDQNQIRLAHAVSINSDDEFENAYTDKPRGNEEGEDRSIRLETRLGSKGIAVVPIFSSENGWRLGPSYQPFDPQSIISDKLAKDIYIKQVKLSRQPVVKHLLHEEIPNCFAKHPLLKHLRPLIFMEDGCEIGNIKVRLDEELGITYETIGKTKNKESK